jgi:group I intron endonuclease
VTYKPQNPMIRGTKPGVYCIKCMVSGRKYIGSASNLNSRKWGHIDSLNKNKHKNKHLQSAWNLYGEKEFEFAKILICPVEQRVLIEQLFITHLNVCDSNIGYNIHRIADSPEIGVKRSPETREKIRQANIRRFEKEDGYWKGKKRPSPSEETLEKKRISAKKMWEDPAYREKVIAARNTPDAVEKRRLNIAKANQDPAVRKRRSEANLGKKRTEEQLARLHRTVKSEEYRKRRSDAMLAQTPRRKCAVTGKFLPDEVEE